MLAGVANPIQNSGQGRSVDQAASLVGVSHDSISRAKQLQARAPELFAEVKAGEVSLNRALRTSGGTSPYPRRLLGRQRRPYPGNGMIAVGSRAAVGPPRPTGWERCAE
jgi:hypothetical protein